jgi:hypothetical protein
LINAFAVAPTRGERVRGRLKPKRTVLVYGGVARSNIDGIEVVPISDFLRDPTAVVKGG